MRKTSVVRARIEPEIKASTEKVLDKLGISSSEAISLFYHQISLRKGLPFDVKIPNATTLAAISDAMSGQNLTRYSSLAKLKSKYL